MENEIWKNVVGFEGIYEVSNLGNVKRLPFTRTLFHGGTFKVQGGKLRHQKSKKGYLLVPLTYLENRGNRFSVHRLVAKAFIPNPDNKAEVNHINGIKHDNRLENLEWATASENQLHAYRNGLKIANVPIGESHWGAKLNDDKVRQIRVMLQQKIKQRDIAKQFDISYKVINSINKNKTWRHVV